MKHRQTRNRRDPQSRNVDKNVKMETLQSEHVNVPSILQQKMVTPRKQPNNENTTVLIGLARI